MSPEPARPILGWREWVTLVELCPEPIKAKVDTGARTSSLHAFDLQLSTSEAGVTTAQFEIHPRQRSAAGPVLATVEVSGFREIRSSTGQLERRPVIETDVAIGSQVHRIDLTLASRDEMGFRMLLGRTAIRRRYLVDPGRSYQQGRTK